jgi:hypothetical protein
MNKPKLTTMVTLAALAALVALGAWPGGAAAQSLRGVIIDYDTGEPIAGARVFLVHHRGVEVMYGVRADGKGRFDAADAIRDGEFKAGERVIVTISARGYKMYEEHIRLPENAVEDEYRLRSVSSEGAATGPARQVWIEMLLIEASGSGGDQPEYPDEIKPVVDNLTPLFKFNRYRIIGRADAMGMEGSTIIFSSNSGEDSDGSFESVAEIGFGNGFVRLTQLSVHVQKPAHRSINTTLNLPEGEMVILGASRGEAAKGSLISVVSARFMTTLDTSGKREH